MRARAPGRALAIGLAAVLAAGCETSSAPNSEILFISITPASDTLRVGETRQLTANVTMSNPSAGAGAASTAPAISWFSSNPAALTVTAGGSVTALASGTSMVRALAGDKADSTSVVVLPASSPPPPNAGNGAQTVQVSPASTSLAIGAAVQLVATVLDSAGHIMSGQSVAWASNTPGVASVSGTGRVTAVSAGAALITATTGALVGSASISVTAPVANICAPTGSGVCRYVDGTAGNDANPGTAAQPYQTLARAAGVVNPGDMVIVRDGVYTGGSGPILQITRGGTATNLVMFRAEHQWGAILDGRSNTSSTGVQYLASYVRVEGFEIRGVNHYGIDMYPGSTGIQAAGNNIHDVGRYCTTTQSGLSAFTVDDQNVVIEQNVIHDIGRYAAGENGCNPSNAYYQNHDHGIYLSSGSNITIRNNIFYNIKRGWGIQRYNTGGAAADGMYVVNNTFAFPNPYRDGQIIIDCPLTNSVITNNIFYQPTNAAVWFDAGPMSNVSVANNITYQGAIATGSSSGATLANNLDNTDPMLVNPGGLDFHLRTGSPAISAGLVLPYVTNDFAGLARSNSSDDVGAYRF